MKYFDEVSYPTEILLAAIYHSLTTGNNMNGGNYAFALLCEKLHIDTETLPEIYTSKWIHKYRGNV